ncbi:MAG: hypothetical protein ACKO3N_09420, partial [Verrucomicrobiota bacterium]
SGGISGMIIRGVATVAPAVQLLSSSTLGGAYSAVAGAVVDAAAKTITVPSPAGTTFYRVSGTSGNVSISVSGANVTIKYP